MTGIYIIRNIKNGLVYIGKSLDIEKRFKQHIYASRKSKKRYNKRLYNDMAKFGIDSFEFKILNECSIDELNDREMYWISYYRSTDPEKGYNAGPGGTHNVGEGVLHPNSILSKEFVWSIREKYKNLEKMQDVYNSIRDQIKYNTFVDVWFGRTYKNIHSDVFCDEIKELRKKAINSRRYSIPKTLNQQCVYGIRKLRNDGYSKNDVKNIFCFLDNSVFESIWNNRRYKNLI